MQDLTRRKLLGAAAIAAGASCAAPGAARPRRRFFGPGAETLGLQIYTLGPDALKDLDRAFLEVARIGYRSVELLSFGDQKAEAVRRALKRSGLVAKGTQTAFRGPGPNLTDHIGRLIDEAHLLGLQYVAATLFDIPARLAASGSDFVRAAAQMTADDWKAYGETLNRVGATLKRNGLRIAHHNHNLEFVKVGDTTGFDLVVTSTDPALVWFEIDVGWVAAAGHDPIALLQRYPGRFRMMHMKDIKSETIPNNAFRQVPAIPGTGVLDWPRLLRAARSAGVTGYYVEEEAPFATSRIDAVRRNFRYLSTLSA
jgi:sugar phosphate isomerase/epimerase